MNQLRSLVLGVFVALLVLAPSGAYTADFFSPSAGGAAITVSTLSAIEALSCAVGDQGKPTDSEYTLECASVGVWSYRYGDHGVVTKPPTSGWTDVGVTTNGGIRTWKGLTGGPVDASMIRSSASANFRVEVYVEFLAFTDNSLSFTLEESGTGKAYLIILSPVINDLFVSSRPNGWDDFTGQTLHKSAIPTFRNQGFHWALDYDGTNVKSELSVDGVEWHQLHTIVATTPFTVAPNQVRIGTAGTAGADGVAQGRLIHFAETSLP